MGRVRPESPNLDRSIQGSTGKGVGILRVELDLHDVMCMALEYLGAVEATIPVPKLDAHVIGTR